ncbi:hypothetical protein AVEN_161437-1 [Araneus ventricosus]|uniref:RNase H type-1 domain-containing protein n=1 Tax=Araneus ventricosus TaxID=182803 RepID=A0A4Y2K8I0_ARAVE|nr:hypothetical protein AVEN_40386-1 [Araneus ventricosus]GBN21544.1 hypothetical protein AVEN_161437-1 [Araneus ventricosus]
MSAKLMIDCLASYQRKLNTIQRPFLLTLTGAYRTTATSSLHVILEIPPLYLQLQQEARVTAIRRLNISLPDTLTTLDPGEIPHLHGWLEGRKRCRGSILRLVRTTVYRWLAKLKDYNTVFQAELLALKHATDHATYLSHQPITILVDNQASVQAEANPRSINTAAREICKSLITNKHIHISWIKAQVGYDGNEEADRLAKEAAESDRDPLSVKAPISFLKLIFKKKMMEHWQSDWKDEYTVRPHLTSCQESPLNHATGKGEKSCFSQETAHFPLA